MDRSLQDFAEFVGREWARRWLEHLQRLQEEQTAARAVDQPHDRTTLQQHEQIGEPD